MTGGLCRESRVGGDIKIYSPLALSMKNQELKVAVESLSRGGHGSVSGSDDPPSAPSSATKSLTTVSTASSHIVGNLTNLDRFIEHTTPSVPAWFFSKTTMKEWKNLSKECHPYFVLGDLWESLKEWSAYGAGVPLILNGSDSVIQYYVPYLSGMQLYVDPSKPVTRLRMPSEECDADSSRGTNSDGSDDMVNIVQGRHQSWASMQLLDRFSLTNNPLMRLPVGENQVNHPPGILIFEYLERNQPCSRQPLADKISDLVSRFPDLKTHRSFDLTPASWFSVAWYPIYRIPTGHTLQSLDACFLMYHSLSTPVSGTCNDVPSFHSLAVSGNTQDTSMPLRLSLPTFGLASYKFNYSFWNLSGDCESQKFNSLLQAADKWNRLLHLNHPDYMFFASHNADWR